MQKLLYNNAKQWKDSQQRRLLFLGMSGVGKTHLSQMLRDAGGWFHYSVDYRIGTRYMGEYIVDNFKREAMRNPFLADLLKSDSIYIGSNIAFGNLDPLSTYLGKPGNRSLGGLSLHEYKRRLHQHRLAEKSALLDTHYFIQRAKDLYNYDNFVCDSGGSICEVVDPHSKDDPVLRSLSQNLLLVWIRAQPDHADSLLERFCASPKPMYYRPEFLDQHWTSFIAKHNCSEEDVDPDAFARFIYEIALQARQPLYAAIAQNWGIAVDASLLATAKTEADITDIIAETLEHR